MSQPVIVTGAFPTSSPTVLGATKAIAIDLSWIGAIANVLLSAGTSTIELLLWCPQSGATAAGSWQPVMSGNADSSVDGGNLNLVTTQYLGIGTHLCLWEKAVAGAVYVPATKGNLMQAGN